MTKTSTIDKAIAPDVIEHLKTAIYLINNRSAWQFDDPIEYHIKTVLEALTELKALKEKNPSVEGLPAESSIVFGDKETTSCGPSQAGVYRTALERIANYKTIDLEDAKFIAADALSRGLPGVPHLKESATGDGHYPGDYSAQEIRTEIRRLQKSDLFQADIWQAIFKYALASPPPPKEEA